MTRPPLAARLRWRLARALWAICDRLDAMRAGALADRLDDVAQRVAPARGRRR